MFTRLRELLAQALGSTPSAPLAAMLLALLLLLPPPAGGAVETVSVSSCQAGLWPQLPLAQQLTPADQFHPTSRDYYQNWALNHMLPPFVLACFAAALLLAFALWRLLKLCTCVRCLRGGQRRRGAAAAALLGSRVHRGLQIAVVVLAAGVVAGSGYGFSTIQPGLEPHGVEVYEGLQSFVHGGLATANGTADAVHALEAGVAAIRQRVEDLDLDQLQPGMLQTIDAFRSNLASLRQGLQAAVRDVQAAVLDRMEALQAEWQPTLDRLDVAKNALLFAAYALLIAFAVATAIGVALNCPSLASPSLALLLLMLLLTWGAVWGTTTGLKVGADGCAAVEEKLVGGLVEAAEAAAASGRGVLATIGVGDTLALSRYYLYGTGRNATEVVADVTGWDVWQLLGQANATVARLQEAAQTLRGANSSMATLPDDLARLSAGVAAAAASARALEVTVSFAVVHPVYMSIKQFACCDVLNWFGDLWLACLIVGCCGVPMALAAFWWLGRTDKLEPRRQAACCHVYRRSDYSSRRHPDAEAPWPPAGGLSGDKGAHEAAAATARLSLQAKLSAAPSWAARGGGDDEFRIGAVPGRGASSQQQLDRSLDLSGLLPEGTPAAPPLSARSQGSARPSAPWHGGWAAAGGSAPQSARELLAGSSLPSSSLNSALNSARGPASSGIPLAVPLTPAAEAVGLSAPPSQRELLPAGEEASDAAAPAAPQPAHGGGGLRRAARRLTHPHCN